MMSGKSRSRAPGALLSPGNPLFTRFRRFASGVYCGNATQGTATIFSPSRTLSLPA